MNTKMLGEITDEVVPWEVNHQCNLMNGIFSQVVNHQVQELQNEKCCGCKVDHPSQRRHDCIMMTKEGWITYGLQAIEHVLQKGILWKQLRKLSESCNSFLTTMHSNTFKNSQVITKPPWNFYWT